MSFYCDASFLVPIFVIDAWNDNAEAFLAGHPAIFVISDFGAAEFSSAIARRVRTRDLDADEARLAFANFDSWSARSAQRIEIATADVALAASFLRRLDLALLTPDAIHIAVAQRLGATLVTFDRQMAANARALGIAVAVP